MSTRQITLTDTWQQITTGTETVFVQGKPGSFALCDSQAQPDADSPFITTREASISPPSSVWVKTFIPGTVLVILDVGK